MYRIQEDLTRGLLARRRGSLGQHERIDGRDRGDGLEPLLAARAIGTLAQQNLLGTAGRTVPAATDLHVRNTQNGDIYQAIRNAQGDCGRALTTCERRC